MNFKISISSFPNKKQEIKSVFAEILLKLSAKVISFILLIGLCLAYRGEIFAPQYLAS